MQAPKSIKSNQYPEFIRSNRVIQSFEKQEKVFPKIGLRNGSNAFSLGENGVEAVLVYLENLRQLLVNEAANQVDTSRVDGIGTTYPDDQAHNKKAFRDA